MSKQTIKAAKSRLARFEAKKVYSYEINRNPNAIRRAGVIKIGA